MKIQVIVYLFFAFMVWKFIMPIFGWLKWLFLAWAICYVLAELYEEYVIKKFN
jgi:hypothetical protein